MGDALEMYWERLQLETPELVAVLCLGVVIFLGGLLVQFLLLKFLKRKSKEDLEPYFRNLFIKVVEVFGAGFFLILALYLVLQTVLESPRWMDIVDLAWLVFVLFTILKVSFILIHFVARKIVHKKRKENPDESATVIFVLASVAKVIAVTLAVLFFISNRGYDITTLLAGLGVGGVAVAFALQNVLEDVFASVSIYFDKPFEVGDFIIVGGDMGVVKSIGFKSTRIQTLEGQELVVSNTELTQSRINNYKKMASRRVVFSFGINYNTDPEKIEKIPHKIQSIIEAREETKFDRAHFAKFGEYALEFEVVYYIQNQDYNFYMDIQQGINLELLRNFLEEKIEFSFPTRTLYIERKGAKS